MGRGLRGGGLERGVGDKSICSLVVVVLLNDS